MVTVHHNSRRWSEPGGLIPERPDWMVHAACRDTPTSVFFPPPSDPQLGAQAKAICADCSVRAACLDWALTVGETGIWGGTSGKERQRMRRRLP